MWILVILAVVVCVVVGVITLFMPQTAGDGDGEESERRKYHYMAKKWFLTRAEHEFYDALGQAVSHEYRIFAQVHLSSLLDEKIKGQDWRAARAHVNRKSVDFLLCDKKFITPRLAIELDDSSHEREDRMGRDTEVERILKEAGIPLLRIRNTAHFDPADLAQKVRESLTPASI